MENLKFVVDNRAFKYYINNVNGREYRENKSITRFDRAVLLRKWNAMVETGIETGNCYKTKRDHVIKVYIGKMKFTVDTYNSIIMFIDNQDFPDCHGNVNINRNKIKFNVELAEKLRMTYVKHGLNTLGNRILMA